jgi:hypothetical protein
LRTIVLRERNGCHFQLSIRRRQESDAQLVIELVAVRVRAPCLHTSVTADKPPFVQESQVSFVLLDDIQRVSLSNNLAAINPKCLFAESNNLVHGVRNQQHRCTAVNQPLHSFRGLSEEVTVANTKDLVNN